MILTKTLSKKSNISTLNKKITIKKIDMINFQKVGKIIENFKPEIIIHLAGNTSHSKSFEKPLQDVDSNIKTTLFMLEKIKQGDLGADVAKRANDKLQMNLNQKIKQGDLGSESGSMGKKEKVDASIFKKAEAQTIKSQGQQEPIIMLDDIFSKLDKKNIKKIIKLFQKNSQTIITHTDKINQEEINAINIDD